MKVVVGFFFLEKKIMTFEGPLVLSAHLRVLFVLSAPLSKQQFDLDVFMEDHLLIYSLMLYFRCLIFKEILDNTLVNCYFCDLLFVFVL